MEIDFVSSDGQVDVVPQHLPELLDPILDFLEAVRISDVVNQDGAVGVSVVNWAQGMKSFLPYKTATNEYVLNSVLTKNNHGPFESY